MTAPLNGLNELDCLKIIAGNISGGGGGSSTLALPVTLTGAPNYTLNQGNGDPSSTGDLVLTRAFGPQFSTLSAYHTLIVESERDACYAGHSARDHREHFSLGWYDEAYPGDIPTTGWETSVIDNPSPSLTGIITAAQNSNTSNVTISNASPAVVTWSSHGLAAGTPVYFSNSGGALPTGIDSITVYFVLTVINGNSFTVAAVPGGAAVATSSAGSGTQSARTPIVITSGTPWSTTYNNNNQSWPFAATLPVLFAGVTGPAGINGVHWCYAIDATHFWVNINDITGSISGISGATWTTTNTAPSIRRWHTTDYDGDPAKFGAHLIDSIEQNGSYFLNDRTGNFRVIAYDAPGTTLTLGNATEGGPMALVSFHSSLAMGAGKPIYLDTSRTGIANPAAVFAVGGGVYTTNGGTIGFVVETANVSTNTSITSGSTSGTVSSASGISNGMSVIGAGIPPGTTVTISGTTVTFSNAAYATNAAAPLTFYTPLSALLCNQDGSVTMSSVSAGSVTATAGTVTTQNAGTCFLILKNTNAGGNRQWNYTMTDDGVAHFAYYNGSAYLSPEPMTIGVTGKVNIGGKLNIAGIPTSSSGLVSGDVYSNAGILTIVP